MSARVDLGELFLLGRDLDQQGIPADRGRNARRIKMLHQVNGTPHEIKS